MENTFQGIRYPIAINSLQGRLARENDYEAYIQQLIRQVLLVAPGERINQPEFGAGIRRMVFSPNNPAAATMVQAIVLGALNNWLSTLIRTDDVKVRADDEQLTITVVYTILARQERRFLNVEVTL